MNDSLIKPDPQRLLPEDLRQDWAVVPRASMYQLFVVAFLLGAGVALSIAAAALDNRWLWLAFPASVVLSWLQRVMLPWPDGRLLRELASRA